MPETVKLFGVWDYVVFAATLIISAAVGIFYALRGGKQQTTSEFLMADRKLPVLPVALSLFATFNSAITITGSSSEFYTRGISFIVGNLGQAFNAVVAATLFIPVFFELKIISVFEYLELRYKSKAVRILACVISIIQLLLYQAVVLYAPSLAVNAVTGLDLWMIITSVGVVCTFYTSIGGLKAVIWTDVFQFVIMLGGLLLVFALGTLEVGSFSEVWQISKEGGRLGGFIFDPDPTIYQSFWSISVGLFFYWLPAYGTSQPMVQRCCSMPTLKRAQMSIFINALVLPFISSLCGFCGLVMYAYYVDCDPLAAGYIDRKDQILPYFVMEVLRWPGVPGVFLAVLCSGTLSTVSSALNSLSAVTWEDMLKSKFGYMEERNKTKVVKLLAVLYGVISIGAAFLMGGAEGVIQVTVLINGSFGGPILGLFTLAIFFPWSNWKGALVGTFTAIGIGLWMGVGATFNRSYIVPPYLPTSVDGCYENITLPTTALPTEDDASGLVKYFYSISYLYNTAIGVMVTILVGLPVSFITGPTKVEEIDESLICFAYRKKETAEDLVKLKDIRNIPEQLR